MAVIWVLERRGIEIGRRIEWVKIRRNFDMKEKEVVFVILVFLVERRVIG